MNYDNSNSNSMQGQPNPGNPTPVIMQTRELKLSTAIHTLLHVTGNMGNLIPPAAGYKAHDPLSPKAHRYVEDTLMTACMNLNTLTQELTDTAMSNDAEKVIENEFDARKQFNEYRTKAIENAQRPCYLHDVKVKMIKPGIYFATDTEVFSVGEPPVYGIGSTPEEALKNYDTHFKTGRPALSDLSMLFRDSPLATVIQKPAPEPEEPDSPNTDDPEDEGLETPA